VTPAREDQGRRVTDASKLTFPLQLVIVIVAGIVGTTGAFWVATSQLRSDIAVIRQVQIDQSKVDEYKAKLEEANRQLLQQSVDAVKAELNAVRGQVQLANIEIGNVRREMNERGVKR
jgi:hypothetical protein